MSEPEFNQMMKGSHAKVRDNIQPPPPNLEQNFSNGITRPNEVKAFESPVSILIHSYRHRLCDPDGISGKWWIDAIVKAGILKDDTAKEVKEVRFQQTKIKKPDEEKTVFVIQEIT